MKTVTYEQFLEFNTCWLDDDEQATKLERIVRLKKEWSALDVLALSNVSDDDKLRTVLREEFIDAPTLHEFACRCGEMALSKIENPDPHSVASVEIKRKWLRGEATDEELEAAKNATWVAEVVAEHEAARSALCSAAMAACYSEYIATAQAEQVTMLKNMLEEAAR